VGAGVGAVDAEDGSAEVCAEEAGEGACITLIQQLIARLWSCLTWCETSEFEDAEALEGW